MKVLLTNDDGIHANGLRTLYKALAEIADVFVIAPSQEKSGVSHGLTINTPLRLTAYQDDCLRNHAWIVDGTPADCVKLGLDTVIQQPLDFVISGINHGGNLGTDVIYSGTVAGAMEGYLCGITSLAVSATHMHRGQAVGNFQAAAQVTVDFCTYLQRKNDRSLAIYNINVPGLTNADIQGIRYTHLGKRIYDKGYDKRVDPHGRTYYWLHGSPCHLEENHGSDIEACDEGYVSISPLTASWTDLPLLAKLQSEDDFNFSSSLVRR